MTSQPPAIECRALPGTPRILGVRLSALGDTLLTFPAMAALRERYPEAHLGFLTDRRNAELFRGNSQVDELLTLDRAALKRPGLSALQALWREALAPIVRGRWDAVIDFQSYTETALLGALSRAPVRVGRRYKTEARWLYRPWIDAPHPNHYMAFAHQDTLVQAGLLEAPSRELGTFLTPPHDARVRWATIAAGFALPAPEVAPRVGLFVGAARADRRWPAGNFVRLAAELDRSAGRPHSYLVFAGPSEGAVVEEVLEVSARSSTPPSLVHAPTADLMELAAAFEGCRLCVSNDTGPLHISVAVGTPTCGIHRRPLAHFLAPAPHRHVVAPDRDVSRVEVADVVEAVAAMLST